MKTRLRHKVIKVLLNPWFRLYFYVVYRFKATPFSSQHKGPYLIVGNHAQVFDPFFMSLSFKEHIYFVASDMIFLHPLFGKLIRFLVQPIPKTKYRSDIETIRDMKRIVKSGGSIGVFPSGNSAYSGAMLPMDEAIAKLAKLLKIPLLIYRIEGNYLAHPRWAKTPRKGKVTGYVHDMILPDQLKAMSVEALHQRIVTGLDVNDFEIMKGLAYKGKNKALFIENSFYMCPVCEAFVSLHSEGDTVTCSQCDFNAIAQDDGTFTQGEKTFYPIPWFQSQQRILKTKLKTLKDEDSVFQDTNETIFEVIRATKKIRLGTGTLRLTKHSLEIICEKGHEVFDVRKLSVSVQQKNKLIIHDTSSRRTFYFHHGARRNAIKYEHAIKIIKGDESHV